jgi:hypothetical protein
MKGRIYLNEKFGFIYNLFSIVFGCIAITVVTFAAFTTDPPYVIGENLVLKEIYLTPTFYLKPITLFTYSFFLAFLLGLYSPNTQRRVKAIPELVRRGFYLVALFVAMASGFEVIYHVVLWSAALSVQGLQNPDIIVNLWPQNEFPINVVFSIKIIVMIFMISLVVIDYLRKIAHDLGSE